MGGDGGQVIDRATMVKTKGWGLTKSGGGRYANSLGEMANYVQMVSEDRGLGTLERHRTRMSQCWLSQEELRDPVVACRLGNLYNKEAIIGALLNKSVPSEIAHIRKLSDVKSCLITWKEEDGRKRIICPLSREDLDSGSARSVFIWSTGAVVSVKSLKALNAKDCPVTGKPFDYDKDTVALAPDAEELAKLRERLPVAASKKRKAGAAAGDAEAANGTAKGSTVEAASSSKADGADATEPTEKKAKKEASDSKKAITGSEVYKSLFTGDRGDGLTGPRDAFGKPIYNRGSRSF